MGSHPHRSRAPAPDGALVSRRALNLDYAMEHDAQLRRTAAYGHGSPEDRRARDSAQASLAAELAPALAVIGAEAWRLMSALNRRYGRQIPLGSTAWLDRGEEAAPYRECALVLRESGWHETEPTERREMPGLDGHKLDGWPGAAPVLRLPGGGGYAMRLDTNGALQLDPLSFDDALAHICAVKH